MTVKKDYLSSIWSVETRQITQVEAGYDPLGMTAGKGCANCNWYVPNDQGCVLVSGDIMPTGVSKHWMAKPEYVQEPIPVVIVGEKTVAQKAVQYVKSLLGIQQIPETFVLYKSANGLRFLCTPTNSFMDRDYDILTSAAHKEFVGWCNKNKQYPELWMWHVAGTKCGSVDWLDYDDAGFLCASGIIDKAWETYVQKACAIDQIGMSHGFIPLDTDKDGDVTMYRSFEFSILPVKNAANVWTSFNVQKGLQEMTLTEDSKNFLKSIGLPEAEIVGFEARNKEVAEKLQASGVVQKEIPVVVVDATAAVANVVTTETMSTGFKAIAEMIGEVSKNVTALSNEIVTVKSAQATITEQATKSIDEQIEALYKSKLSGQPIGFVATKSDTNATNAEQDAAVKGSEGKPVSFIDTVLDSGLKVAGSIS